MSKEIIEGYRLSPQQKHLWLLGESERSATCAVRIDGELNPDLLEQAIRQVVERFEILRTTFKLLPGSGIGQFHVYRVIAAVPYISQLSILGK